MARAARPRSRSRSTSHLAGRSRARSSTHSCRKGRSRSRRSPRVARVPRRSWSSRRTVRPPSIGRARRPRPPGSPPARLPDTATDATDHLPLGAYWIVEQPPAGGPAGGWTLTTVRCGGVLVPFAQGAVEVKLTPAHPRLRCVYTDTLSATPPPPPLPPVNPPPVAPPPAPVFPLVPGLPAYQLSDLVVTKQASASIVTQGDVGRLPDHGQEPRPQPGPARRARRPTTRPRALRRRTHQRRPLQGSAADSAPDHLRTRHAATRRQSHGDGAPADRDHRV